MSPKLIQVVALIAAVCATGWAHARLPNETRTDRGEAFVPAPHVVEAASLGFDAILADYYWLQAVQVAGANDVIDADTASHLGKLVDVVTTLNPYVDHPYRFAAVWMTHSEEQVRDANLLLERAIEFHPEDWRNYFYLGFNQFYYLGDFEAAASALEGAVANEGSPAYLPRLLARLQSQQGDIDVAEIFLRQLLVSTDDESEIAKIEGALDEIEIEHKARHLDRAREA
ncbi:tetratricopeptide repeat protein, partial [Myxococcota bacterium]|nr:tetratricopeptide repeat protein [Myxococcota bacterium]